MGFISGARKLRKKVGGALKGAGKVLKNAATTTGGGIKKAANATGSAAKKVTKATGSMAKKSVRTAGGGIKKATRTTGGVLKKSAVRTGSAVKKTARATGRVVKNITKKVTKTGSFNLNCHFLICHSEEDFTDKQVQSWINERVLLAEKLYAMKPKLKVKSTFSRVKDGRYLVNKSFSSGKEYNAFMNTHFDNVSKHFTSGRLHFLVANYWAIDNSAPCGRAFFPMFPGWKKHAIYLRKKPENTPILKKCSVHTFSHELGHVFGLMHTFQKGGLCTATYSKREGSTNKNGRSNLMDYKRVPTVYLNDCQERVAALTRRRHMTVTGKTKYHKLSGLI